jgi:hypothetical protein
MTYDADTAIGLGQALIDEGWTLDDAEDGAALRRLREALPDGAQVLVTPDVGGFTVAWRYREPDRIEGWYAGGPLGAGATIAEAADKCREAL